MNLQQFRFIHAAIQNKLNLTEAANALHTSQSGVSRAIIELEEELGIEIFERYGKRIRNVTEPGKQVLRCIDSILSEVSNLKRIGQDYRNQNSGNLAIAATHSQARYVLPRPIAKLRQDYPLVHVSLHQCAPQQVVRMLLDNVVDIGIATESITGHSDLVTLPCYEWQHMLVLRANHYLAQKEQISLQDLKNEPIITYQNGFTGRARINLGFKRVSIVPLIVLEAMDSDVIKTYVQLGLGLGIVAEMATQELDNDLVAVPLGHLFGANITRVAFRRGAYLRKFVYHFAELLSERLEKTLVERAIAGNIEEDYAL